MPFVGEHSPYAIVTNLFLIQALGLHSSETWNGPAWSISVEFVTYLVFAGLCMVVPRTRTRLLLALMLSVGGAIALFRLSPLGMQDTFRWPLLRCLYGFFLGVLTHAVWSHRERIGGTFAEIAAVITVCAFITFAAHDPLLAYLATPIFAVAVLVFASERGMLSRALAARVPQALGRWSYSIYMIHMFLISVLFAAAHGMDAIFNTSWLTHRLGGTAIDLGNQTANDLLFLIVLALVIIVAAFTYRFVELPGQRLLDPRPRVGTTNQSMQGEIA
jgi:peptidoglycan/LPS O-acetylase OafA/YrhL